MTDRTKAKVLAELAVSDKAAFGAIAEKAKASLSA